MDKYFKDRLKEFLKSEVYNGYEPINDSQSKVKNALLASCYDEDAEFLNFVIKLINAEFGCQTVRCDFNNEYFRGDHRSEQFIIYGKGQLILNDEILLHHSPSNYFEYKAEDDDWDFSNHLSHMLITSVNHYEGSFTFTGFLESDTGESYVDFYSADIFNDINYSFIKDDSSEWCQYILQGYRFYSVKSYQTAFLMFFIALDSFIEFNIEKLVVFYKEIYQQLAECAMRCYLKQDKYPVEEFIMNNLINDPVNTELGKLKNKSRKLIHQKLKQILFLSTDLSSKQTDTLLKNFILFEKVRNTIAHGNRLDIEELKSEFAIVKKYLNTEELDFKRLSVSILIELASLIYLFTN